MSGRCQEGNGPRISRMVLWPSPGHPDVSKNWIPHRLAQPLLSTIAHRASSSPSSTQLQGAAHS